MKDAIAQLRTPSGTGTAWLCSREYALTAAHCVEVRQSIAPNGDIGLGYSYPADKIVLEFPWPKENKVTVAEVVHFDLGLDAALLRLPDAAVPRDVQPFPIAALPRKTGAAPIRWSAYGFPRAHKDGLTLTGSIDDADGKVGKYSAMQLICDQGGLGELNGASGSAVCANNIAVGLIRYGTLAHRVVFAASIADISAAFPEVHKLLGAAPGPAWVGNLGSALPPLPPEAEKIWRQKRDYFLVEFAKAADAGQKFALLKGIAEADSYLQGRTLSWSARTIWQDKLNFYQQQRAITADAAQRFALDVQIEEAQRMLQEIE